MPPGMLRKFVDILPIISVSKGNRQNLSIFTFHPFRRSFVLNAVNPNHLLKLILNLTLLTSTPHKLSFVFPTQNIIPRVISLNINIWDILAQTNSNFMTFKTYSYERVLRLEVVVVLFFVSLLFQTVSYINARILFVCYILIKQFITVMRLSVKLPSWYSAMAKAIRLKDWKVE